MTTETQSVAAVPSAGRGFAWRRSTLAFGITLMAIIAFAVAFAAAYAAFHQGRVLPGVSVGNIPIAGLDRAGAATALRVGLPNVGSGALTVKIGDQTTVITYSEIGRDYDMNTMLDTALGVGRSGTPADQVGAQLRTLLSGVSVPVVVKWDAQKLAALVGSIASAADVEPVDATITRPHGAYAVTPAVAGEHVDAQQLISQAMSALHSSSAAGTSISIQPTPVPPTISTEQAQTAVDRANSVASQPLSVTVAGQTQTIDPDTIRGWTHLDPAGTGRWLLTVEKAPIDQWVGLLKSEVDVRATNAGYTFEGNKAVVTPDAPGSSLDAASAAGSIMAALNSRTSGTPADAVNLAMATVAPEFTIDQAQGLVTRVKRLSSWTTHYDSSAHNGFGQNIRRPTKLINGTVVQPDETFDFLAVAGPITVRNGYTDGAAIIHGNSVLDGVLGGGLCSTSTTCSTPRLGPGSTWARAVITPTTSTAIRSGWTRRSGSAAATSRRCRS